MTDEQQPSTPRPGPHLFGAGPSAVRPVPGVPTAATPGGSGDEPERAAAVPEAETDPPHPGAEPTGSGAPPRSTGGGAGGLEPTGEPRVDEALAVLDELTGRPTGDQVAGYEQVHRSLQDVLATVDEA